MLFQHTSPVECRSCVVYAQDNILCQFGLINLSSVQQLISQPILIHFWWELYHKLPKVDTLQAQKFIAQQLIHNKYMSEKEQVVQTPTSESSRHSTQQSSEHCFTTLPTFKKFKNLRIVKCKSKYQKWQCKCKAASVRSYCKCSPGVIRCVECYEMHRIDSEM